jgi:hypothetical protein
MAHIDRMNDGSSFGDESRLFERDAKDRHCSGITISYHLV